MSITYDLIVIGTGPGGYVCAIRAAQLGLKTAVVEKRATYGGTCLNIGCIPSKALLHASELYEQAGHTFGQMGIKIGKPAVDLAAMMKFKDAGVEIVTGVIVVRRNAGRWERVAASSTLSVASLDALTATDVTGDGTADMVLAGNLLVVDGRRLAIVDP